MFNLFKKETPSPKQLTLDQCEQDLKYHIESGDLSYLVSTLMYAEENPSHICDLINSVLSIDKEGYYILDHERGITIDKGLCVIDDSLKF